MKLLNTSLVALAFDLGCMCVCVRARVCLCVSAVMMRVFVMVHG